MGLTVLDPARLFSNPTKMAMDMVMVPVSAKYCLEYEINQLRHNGKFIYLFTLFNVIKRRNQQISNVATLRGLEPSVVSHTTVMDFYSKFNAQEP